MIKRFFQGIQKLLDGEPTPHLKRIIDSINFDGMKVVNISTQYPQFFKINYDNITLSANYKTMHYGKPADLIAIKVNKCDELLFEATRANYKLFETCVNRVNSIHQAQKTHVVNKQIENIGHTKVMRSVGYETSNK